MSAVGAFPTVGVERRIGKHRRVVLFVIGCGFISHCLINLLFGVVAAHDGADSRTRQRVVNALHRTQAHAERRTLFVKQSAAGEALHDCDADVIFFTDAV